MKGSDCRIKRGRGLGRRSIRRECGHEKPSRHTKQELRRKDQLLGGCLQIDAGTRGQERSKNIKRVFEVIKRGL